MINAQPIIYTMGKVGSRAIDLALEAAGVPSWHIHTLDQKQIRDHMARAVDSESLLPGHVGSSCYLLRRNLKNPLYISCVRDPVARNLSAFFQNLGDYVQNPESASPQYVLDVFTERYDHRIPLTWFDREWRNCLGIDIYAEKTADHNYKIFTETCSNDERSRFLSDATGKTIRVLNSNVGEMKQHGQLYADIKRNAKLSEALADEIYSSKFVRRFWSADEADQMHRTWTSA